MKFSIDGVLAYIIITVLAFAQGGMLLAKVAGAPGLTWLEALAPALLLTIVGGVILLWRIGGWKLTLTVAILGGLAGCWFYLNH